MTHGRTILFTGGTGYLGSHIAAAFEDGGWRTKFLGRQQPSPYHWRLGDVPEPDVFENVDLLLHGAYDMGITNRDRIRHVNVDGTRVLLEKAANQGVKRFVLISSIAAFDGCRSDYGQAKLECERIAAGHDALIVRPGLVYGEQSAGVYAAMEHWVDSLPLNPVLVPSPDLYTCHMQDLCSLLTEAAEQVDWKPLIVTAASESPLNFKQIILVLQRRLGVRKPIVPVPWRFPWLVLKAMELVRIRPPFRSDGLTGLMKANPAPDFSGLHRFSTTFREFAAA